MCRRLTKELAFLLGAYAAEGHTSVSNWSVVVTNSVPAVLARVKAAWKSEFDLNAVIYSPPNRCAGVRVASKRAALLLEAMGCGHRASSKRIPETVMSGTRDAVLAFLQGLALDAYVIAGAAPKWAICLDSSALLDDLQLLLRRLGYVSSRVHKLNRQNGKTYDEVYLPGQQAQRFLAEVPFLEPDKSLRASVLQSRWVAQSTADIVPLISGPDLYALIPRGRPGRRGRGTSRSGFAFLSDPRTRFVSRRSLERAAAFPGVCLPGELRRVLTDEIHFSPVAAISTNPGKNRTPSGCGSVDSLRPGRRSMRSSPVRS
ncbi:MAG: ribonucleoside-diphosphate reductase alpha chain [Actinomycetota bacterium]|nr:ribonucleoside-diphosphate reductase alpha chain [Actinomycetota bacterium]